MPATQYPLLEIWGCYDKCEPDWEVKNNRTLEVIWTELTGKCVCGDTTAGTLVNDSGNVTNPTPGTAIVDANGCLSVFVGPVKGWVTNGPICGREVTDTKTGVTYKWLDGAWKITDTCETVVSSTIAPKGTSPYPPGNISFNTSATPWVEYITINGVFVATGNVFDPQTCKLSSTSVPIVCADNDADAVTAWADLCYEKVDGLQYFNNISKTLKVCKGGEWEEVVAQDNCCKIDGAALAPGPVGTLVYWDILGNGGAGAWAIADAAAPAVTVPPTAATTSSTATHAIVEVNAADDYFKVQSSGPTDIYSNLSPGVQYYLNPAIPGDYTNAFPVNTGEIVQPAFTAITSDKAELLLNLPPSLIEVDPFKECFIGYQLYMGTGLAMVANIINTRPITEVVSTASFATANAAGGVDLSGGCCYTVRGVATSNGANRGHSVLIDTTTGNIIQTGLTSFSANGPVGGVNTFTSDNSEFCAEICVPSGQTLTIELGFIPAVDGIFGIPFFAAGLGDRFGKLEVTKKRDL